MDNHQTTLLLIDGHAILFRAYHAMPPLTTPDGRPSGAVYGFTNVMLRMLRELEPTWVVGCFDAPGPTFRDAMYADYKATRTETPADIITQDPMVHEVLHSLGIPTLALPGFEADDLIATLVRQGLNKELRLKNNKDTNIERIVIVTGDRDLLQLSGPKVVFYLLRRGTKDIDLLDEAGVTTLLGVRPDQLIDWKALRGDSSDNIIGVPGIGEKTATDILTKNDSLTALYSSLDAQRAVPLSPRIQESLMTYRDRVKANQDLVRLKNDVPIELDLAHASRAGYQRAEAAKLLATLGFHGIISRLPEDLKAQQGALF